MSVCSLIRIRLMGNFIRAVVEVRGEHEWRENDLPVFTPEAKGREDGGQIFVKTLFLNQITPSFPCLQM